MSVPKNLLALSLCAGAFLSFSACLATGSIDGDPEPYSKGPKTGGKNPKVDGGAVDPGGDPAPPPPEDPASGDDAAPAPPPPPATDSGARPPTDSGAAKDTAPPTPPPTGDYPPGPYGYSTGSTYPKVSFPGYRNGAGAWVTISMADYYDPTGARGINALFLDVSAGWCGACRAEAADLPTMATKYKPRGGRIVTALIEGDSSSTPATQANVDEWKSTFSVNFDIVADGKSDSLGSGGVGLPHNYVIDPRTMKIVKIVEGSSGGSSLPGGFDTLLTKNGG